MDGAGWARSCALLRQLIALGTRHWFVSPGSRSTPLLLALLREVKAGHAEAHSLVDERSAAFAALGCARTLGQPAAVLATSGSAAAHWLPAAMEAYHAGHRLILVSADRPQALVGTGANQTTAQQQLFARHSTLQLDLDMECNQPQLGAQLETWSADLAGPLHLNLRFDKPLEPKPEALTQAVDALPATGPNNGGQPARRRTAASTSLAPPRLGPRPLLLMGPSRGQLDAKQRRELQALAQQTELPVIAEHLSGWPDAGGGLRSLVTSLETPSCVLSFGLEAVGAPLPPSWLARRYALDEGDAARWIPSAERLAELRAVLNGLRLDPAWPAAVAHGLQVLESARRCAHHTFDAAYLCRTLVESLPTGSHLLLGNSLIVRHFEASVSSGARLRLQHQRGLSGIDGQLAALAGMAYAAPADLTVALLGDVSFAHDVGSLSALAAAPGRSSIVVFDNGGGRIFETLPLGGLRLEDTWQAFWRTPPRTAPMQAYAAAAGFTRFEAGDPASLARALAELPKHDKSLLWVRMDSARPC